MSHRRELLQSISPLQLTIIGTLLIGIGGLAYTLFSQFLAHPASILLVSGVTIFLQPSRGFHITGNARFFISLFVANAVVVLIDFWFLQLLYAQAARVLLHLWGIPTILNLQSYFGGLRVILLVPEASTGRLIGGEIDNACAGLIVLVPSLVLTIITNNELLPPPNRVQLSLFILALVIIGNYFRILFELWLPAIGLAPFWLVHYPLAFVLGMIGVIVIFWVGNRLAKTPTE